ncbi:glycosyl hydrolase family 8 [Candidatus Binatia bacterium]|nr:glycosyl hydrolase family 8 [Candidatus Binatia bacterium]
MTTTGKRMRAWWAGVAAGILLAAALAAPAAGVNHPFGSRPFSYAPGTIVPNHLAPAALDQAVRDFYDAWKARYLLQTCGAGRYVVVASVKGGNLTVSEAHGYGMVLAALMAGHDPDARAIFDGMLAYFHEHPSVLTPGLMSWYQRRTCTDAEDGDSASDGDLDIAFALLLAEKQWGNCGTFDYGAEAQQILAAIRTGELDSSGRYVRLGDWTVPSEPDYYYATRSSDFMPDHLRVFAAATGDSIWTDVLDHTYTVFDAVQTTHSPTTGLLPDFIADPLGTPDPVGPHYLEGPNDGAYDYNACRDPWRLGTDYVVAGDARAKTAVQRITNWFRSATGNDPNGIQAGYQLNGTLSAGANYRSMAFVAPLGVAAMADAGNQAWLNDIWDLVDGTSIDDEAYYENTLKLLAMIVMSGNWWTPPSVSGGCVPAPSTPICTGGGYLSGLDIKIGAVTAGPARQSLRLKGGVFFPLGIPATTPYTNGAQLLIEDLGNGNSAVFDISRFTTPIPPASAGPCGSGDGWKVATTRTTYRNRSTALDPPVCTAGSSGGLSELRYRPYDTTELEVQAKARRATIAAPLGPLRASLVLGNTQAAGDNGVCAISTVVPCTPSGNSVRCR